MKDIQLPFWVSKEEKILIDKAVEKANGEMGFSFSRAAFLMWLVRRFLNERNTNVR